MKLTALPDRRRQRTLRQAMVHGCQQALLITGVTAASFVMGMVVANLSPSAADQSEFATPDPAAKLIVQHDCSTSGLANHEIPASALVRREDGTVQQVSFDEGWAVYEGKRPGSLVAVCRAPLTRKHS